MSSGSAAGCAGGIGLSARGVSLSGVRTTGVSSIGANSRAADPWASLGDSDTKRFTVTSNFEMPLSIACCVLTSSVRVSSSEERALRALGLLAASITLGDS